MTFSVRLEGGALRFSAAHFTTFGGDCEPLHGHNYAVVVEISGGLSGDSWVMDFSDGKRIVADVCKGLDHKFILQARSAVLSVVQADGALEVRFGSRLYVIPEDDVVALPIENSTAERLAEWIAHQVAREVAEAGVRDLESIRVGVEEAPGQSGWFTLAIAPRRSAGSV